MTYPYLDDPPPRRRSWWRRVVSRIHDRLDAIFIVGYLTLMGFLAYYMHQLTS
jgi:hypothetical protein